MSRIDLRNTTSLADARLLSLFEEGINGWAVGTVLLRVRYSRGADFSGACYYADRRIHVNLGRHLRYPYQMQTGIARAKTIGRRWYKPLYAIQLADAYQVVLFVFMHELYHLLVKRAKRNTRQKESMCDRFATRHLVDRFGASVWSAKGQPVPREVWDFQNLEGFVAAARDRRIKHPARRLNDRNGRWAVREQLLLFGG
ncbi:MAG: hypothetical protein PVI86_05575 [Phycisphaerae bacterium]|jgi:hypothetical protein